jgi:hypothetical protein
MNGIGIIGAGIAGLQLALFLQQHDLPVTLYADRTADAIMAGRLPNTVGRFGHTRLREQALGVDHWGAPDQLAQGFHVRVGGEMPIAFDGRFQVPASTVDMRLYAGTLLQDFETRGGDVVIGAVDAVDVARLANHHDLMVVASGRGPLADMFPRIPEHTPFTSPQRMITAGYFHGLAGPGPLGAGINLVPGQGEIFHSRFQTFGGPVTNLLIEGVPGSEFAALRFMRYEDDPQRFEDYVLYLLRTYVPHAYAGVNRAEFGLTRPLDLVQGAILPTVRRPMIELDAGKFAIAIGDVFTQLDPVAGQGANTASVSAAILGEAILDEVAFDATFCRRVEQRLMAYAEPVSAWAAAILLPPPPHVIEFMVAASVNPAIADAFGEGFNRPVRMWNTLMTPQRTAAFLRRYGWTGMPTLALAA